MSDDQDRNLGFEETYRDADFAARYARKHDRSAGHRLRDRREQSMWRRALEPVGRVAAILDCPAGTGRFWPLLVEMTGSLHAVDASAEMLAAARARHPDLPLADARVAMAQDLPQADASFPLVFSSRLLHHLPAREDRRAVLAGLARVSSGWLAFSTWRSGNWMSWRRGRAGRQEERASRYFLPIEEILADVAACGLEPVRIVHKQRLLSPVVAILCRKLV
ncbi:MAG: class I SAM-dependent methyltransferase [Planctomycetes bacterium]|nr:class I SAM-dependent methyltransferase [Planctomycetota bacterium]